MTQFQVIATPSFLEKYQQMSPRMQRLINRKIDRLAKNPSHRSLQAHRVRRAKGENVWSCYISINKRLLYQYKDSTIYLWEVGEHAIVERAHLRRFG